MDAFLCLMSKFKLFFGFLKRLPHLKEIFQRRLIKKIIAITFSSQQIAWNVLPSQYKIIILIFLDYPWRQTLIMTSISANNNVKLLNRHIVSLKNIKKKQKSSFRSNLKP